MRLSRSRAGLGELIDHMPPGAGVSYDVRRDVYATCFSSVLVWFSFCARFFSRYGRGTWSWPRVASS